MTAKTVRSRKSKGRNFQNTILKKIQKATGLSDKDIRTVPSSVQGVDIWLSEKAQELFPFAVECKRQEKLNLWEALEQAETNAKDLTPLLIFKRNRGKIYACLDFEKFLNLFVENNKLVIQHRLSGNEIYRRCEEIISKEKVKELLEREDIKEILQELE